MGGRYIDIRLPHAAFLWWCLVCEGYSVVPMEIG